MDGTVDGIVKAAGLGDGRTASQENHRQAVRLNMYLGLRTHVSKAPEPNMATQA